MKYNLYTICDADCRHLCIRCLSIIAPVYLGERERNHFDVYVDEWRNNSLVS